MGLGPVQRSAPGQRAFVAEGGRRLTPEEVQRQRLVATALMRQGADFSPAGSFAEALGRGFNGWASGRLNTLAGEAQDTGMAGARDSIMGNPVLSALMGGGSDRSIAPGVANVPGVGGTAFPASLIDSESGGNWNALNSEGYGGRLQFGDARLADAARAGIIPAGMTGAQFAQLPPEAQQAVEQWHFADIDRQAQARGLDQYLGQTVGGVPVTQDAIRGMAHLGGIGGAARFLASGGQYNPEDSNGTSLRDYGVRHGGGGGAGASYAQPNQNVIAALMGAAADPWVQEAYGPQISALIDQQMGMQSAQYDAQLRQQDPMYQAELARMTAPQVNEFDQRAQVAAQYGLDPQSAEFQRFVLGGELGGGSSLINAGGGQIYDPASGQWITAPQTEADEPDSVRALRIRANEAGLQPGTPEYSQFMVAGGQSSGMALDVDPSTGAVSFRQGAGAGRPLTEGQSKDVLYATRASGSLPVIDALEQSLMSYGEYAAGSLPAGLGNYLQSEDYQVAQNAGKEYLASILRKDTGAAVTPSEEKLYGDIFLPRPGDKPATLQRKRQARGLALEAIKAGMPANAIESMARALNVAGPEAATASDGWTDTGNGIRIRRRD